MPVVDTIFLLLAAVTALALLARRSGLPFPIVLVLGGLVLGFVPGLPEIELRSEIVFLAFLPPLLYISAFLTSWRDFRKNLDAILMLAIGLVVITAGAVAVVAHALIAQLSWPAAFVLGAVIAPTDAVATEAIAERLHLPRRILAILQGESLVNDATAIVVYGIALNAAQGDGFSLWRGLGDFARVSIGGIATGLLIGWIVGEIRKRLPRDPTTENTVSLLTPLSAYLPAEQFHVSGVLSVVACGMYLGRIGPGFISSRTRLQAAALWQVITFLLNGLLFLLVGLQLRRLVLALPADEPFGEVLLSALLISLTTIVVRILWVFLVTYLPFLPRKRRHHDTAPVWRRVAIVAWSGMRGGISLAVALAIPATLGSGPNAIPFPARNAILVITFVVILVTMVGQGLSLPPLIRALGVVGGQEEREEEFRARMRATEAALERLEVLADDSGLAPEVLDEIRHRYTNRQQRLHARFAPPPGPPADADPGDTTGESPETHAEEQRAAAAYLRLRHDLLRTERDAILSLRDRGTIGDDILHLVQTDLDLDESRLPFMTADEE